MDELSQMWGELTDIEQADITRLVAGLRNAQGFGALLTSFDDARLSMELFGTTSDDAMKKNEIMMDSIQKKTLQVSAAFQKFAGDVIDSGLIKFVLDAGVALLKLLDVGNGIIGKIVGVPVVIFAIATAIKTLELTKIGTGIADTFKSFAAIPGQLKGYGDTLRTISALNKTGALTTQSLADAMDGLSKEQISHIAIKYKDILATEALTEAELIDNLQLMGLSRAKAEETAAEIINTTAKGANTAATGAQVGANVGLVASLRSVVAGLWETAVAWAATPMGMATIAIGAIMGIIGAINAHSRAIAEDQQATIERAKVANEELKSITDLITKYKELKATSQMDDNTRNEIKNIQEEITKLVGEQSNNLDLVNGNLDQELDKLQKINIEYAKKALQATEAAKINAQDEFNKGTRANSAPYPEGIRFGDDAITAALNKTDVISQKDKTYMARDNGGDFLDLLNGEDAQGILDKLTLWQKAFIDLGDDGKTAISSITKYINFYQEKVDAFNRTQTEFIKLAQESADGYYKLSDGQKSFVEKYLRDLELTSDEIVDFINYVSGESNLQQAMDHLFTLDPSGINYQSYVNLIKSDINKIQQLIFDEYGYLQDPEDIILNLGFNIDIETAKAELLAAKPELINMINEVFSSLNADDIAILTKMPGVDFGEYINPESQPQLQNSEVQLQNLIEGLERFKQVTADAARQADLARNLQDVVDKTKSLNQALAEQNNTGKISQETYAAILSKGDDYKNLIGLTTDGYELLGEETVKYINELIEQGIQTAILNGATEEEINQIRNLGVAYSSLTDSISNVQSMSALYATAQKEMAESGYITIDTFNQLAQATPTISEYIEVQNSKLKFNAEAWNQNVGAVAAAKKAMEDYADSLPALNERTEGQTAILEYLNETYIRLQNGYLDTVDVAAQLTDNISSLASSYSVLTSAQEEYNENEELSIQTLQSLLALGDDYLQYLDFSDGKIRLNIEALDQKVVSLQQEMIASSQATLAEKIRAIVEDDLKGTTDDLANATDTARQKLVDIGNQALTTAGEMVDLASTIEVVNSAFNGELDASGLSEDAMNKIKGAISNTQTEVNAILALGAKQPNISNSLKAPSSSSSKSSEDTYKENAEKEFKDLKYSYDKKLISDEQYYTRLNALNEKYYKGKENYLDDYRKYELEAVNGLEKVAEQNIENQFKELKYSYDAKLISEEEYYKKLGALNERYYKGNKDHLDDYRKYEMEIVDGLSKLQEQKLEYQLSDAEDAGDYEKQINIYRQYQDILHDQAEKYRALGFRETDAEIQELQKKWRAYGKQIEKVYDDIVKAMSDKYQEARDGFDRNFAKLEFQISLTSDNDIASKEGLINRQIDNRILKSRELVKELIDLRLETDKNITSTDSYKDLMYSLEDAYDANVKEIYELIKAQKSLAESQISEVRDLQGKVIDMLKARYQKEQDLAKESYDLKKKNIDDEKDLLKKRYDAEVGFIDDQLKALENMWSEEDARKRKQDDIDDVNDIQRKINELKIAVATGDAEA